MEQDCIAGLYRSLGMSVGAEFTSEDVSLLYLKVFHFSSNTDEAHVAKKKIAGGDSSWSCVGENVLDVLLEMDRDRENKEKLYWDLQLVNVGNLNTLYMLDKPVIMDPCVQKCLHQNTDPNTLKKELHGSVRGVQRLRKAARQCWARLTSEGVHSVLPPQQGRSLGVRHQAWGCVSTSDVLLLVEVKYDVVTQLLYTEMLQEHYTLSIWDTLLPWQQHEEREGLGDRADEALKSGDMLRLSELPGAFRIYRSCLKSPPESREQSWSAVSLLCELHTFRQQEKDTLTVLGQRLDRESLRLLCLFISLATLRAQRERMSYSALLAARQSWETWPHVESPCRAEQATLWLHGEEEEQKKDFISVSPQQQAVLQLLVLIQDQEREHLVQLANRVSMEDLQDPVPSKEESNPEAALRNACIQRLRQIYTGLQTSNDTQTPLKQTDHQPQPHISSQTAVRYKHQLEQCSLLLLTHLMELQEVQATTLLPALKDESAESVQALRDEYKSELQAPRYTNLLQLISDAPLTSGSILTTDPNSKESSSNAQNSIKGPDETSSVDSISDLQVVQATACTDQQDVCTGCGAVMEDLPYLEILCVSDATSNTHNTDGGAQGEEGAAATKGPQSFEKQGSLIAFAWSQPAEDETDYEEEGAAGAAQRQEVQSSDTSSTAEHTQGEETSAESDRDEKKPTQLQSESTDHPHAQSADQQGSTVEQLTFEERATTYRPEKGDFECDLQTKALGAETLQALNIFEPPEVERYARDYCSELGNKETPDVDREMLEVEVCANELWDLRGPEPAHVDDHEYNSQVTVDCSPAGREATRESTLMERERAREPVSAMERERTMRNLVDMQRKVEQRQQRDKARQLLRVQEHLSIIQNRKAEEDLLGLKHTDRLRHLTQDLPQEDKNQQKTVVKERLEQLRRERSYVMQSKRARNTAGFKELLGPVALHSRQPNDGAD
ncbi:hypothetical protein CesoFtcFv8_007605 [Champsocephalus esox]|uniref:Uncharacterized protein n=1 Tax=Champsocephalus esox TaxID=159716 RepID=A0AAN8H4I3_9TELE|nr:hypothetical protein CesoFtcFv8_007605 [Champsocephalus esox]